MKMCIVILVLLLAGSVQAATLTVCHSGCEYSSIQAAIDAANAGDTVEVHSGGYNEQASVIKDIALKGIDTGGGVPVVKIIALCGHSESVISDIKSCVIKSDCSDNSGSSITCPGLSGKGDVVNNKYLKTPQNTEVEKEVQNVLQSLNDTLSNLQNIHDNTQKSLTQYKTPTKLAGSTQSATITVCPFGCDYTDIQAAVNAAHPGDEISVYIGTFNKVVFDKTLTLHGSRTGIINDISECPSIKTIYKCGYKINMTGTWCGLGKIVDACVTPTCSQCAGTEDVVTDFRVKTPQHAEAEQVLQNTLQEINEEVTWNDKGAALYNQGKYDEAIKCYNEAIKINPHYAPAWYNKGNVLNSQGKYDEAIECYDEAIGLNPQLVDAWGNKGSALNSQGKYDEAIQACDKAIDLNPQYAMAWNNKGAALYNQGKYDEAIECYNEAIKINPQYALALTNKGVVLYSEGKYDEAIQALDTAIKINPQYADAWHNKGVALESLGCNVEAQQAYAKAKELGYTG